MARVEFTSHKEEVLNALSEQLQGALEAIGADAASTAANKAPVNTGNLKNSISFAVEGNTVYVGTNVEYAIYHELGTGVYASNGNGRQDPWGYVDQEGHYHVTRGVKARHFLQFGVQAHKSEYADIIKNALSK